MADRKRLTGPTVTQVRGSSLLTFVEPVRLYSGAKSVKRQANMKLQAGKAYSGGMTQGSRKRMAKAITILTQAIEPVWITNPATGNLFLHRLSFITLTVTSQKNITARQAYDELLSHFLDWMTRTAAEKSPGLKTYIWKAEEQKRGQIHYHITTPGVLHWLEIRDKWNALQRKAGLLDDYAKKNGHFNANSTDIHEVQKVRNMDRYLIKELCKTLNAAQLEAQQQVYDQVANGELSPALAEEKIQEIYEQKIVTIGKLWGCSEDLAGVGYFTIDATRAHEAIIEQWILEGKARRITEDFFEVVYCEGVDPPDLLSRLEKVSFKDYLQRIMSRHTAQPDIVPAACVQMEGIDETKEYSLQQLALNFN